MSKLLQCSRTTIYRKQIELSNAGFLQRDEKGNIIKPEVTTPQTASFNKITKTEFAEDPLILTWIKSMQRSGIVDWQKEVNRLWIVCETLQIKPDGLHQGITEVQNLIDMFEKEFKEGRAKYISPNSHHILKSGEDTSSGIYTKAVKSFRVRLGQEVPTGFLEVHEKKHQAYQLVKLNDIEYKKAIEFFSQFNDDTKRLFILHHEFGVRSKTLFKMQPTFERHTTAVDNRMCEYYTCHPYETKQEAMFEKIIIRPEAREIVKTLKDNEKLWSGTDWQSAKANYNKRLREMFAYIGKINLAESQNYEIGSQQYYMVTNPTHAIRHSCIHWLMRITGYRKDTVASMFWEEPDTLSVYANMSIKSIIDQGVCYICNMPPEPDQRFATFCTLRHAILFYNLSDDERASRMNITTKSNDDNPQSFNTSVPNTEQGMFQDSSGQ
jgi:hypothetical protein